MARLALLLTLLLVAAPSFGQDLPRVRTLLGKHETGIVILVVTANGTVLRHAPGRDGPDLLPLAGLSPIAVAHLLHHHAAEHGWDLATTMHGDDTPRDVDRIGTWTWSSGLSPSPAALPAYRFLEPGAAPRSAEEFAAAHVRSLWEAVRPPDLEVEASSQAGMALLQSAIERRSGLDFTAWAEATADAIGLGSLTVGGPPLEGVPDAEIDAAHDLRLSIDDLERLLRRQAEPEAPQEAGSYYQDSSDAWFHLRESRSPGAVRAGLASVPSAGITALWWSNDPEVDVDAFRDAIVHDLTGRPFAGFLSLGGGYGRRPRIFARRDGAFRGTIPSVDTPPIELELTWKSFGAVLRVLPDGRPLGLGNRLRLDGGRVELEGGATFSLALEDTDVGYRGIALVGVPGRSLLPYAIELTAVR